MVRAAFSTGTLAGDAGDQGGGDVMLALAVHHLRDGAAGENRHAKFIDGGDGFRGACVGPQIDDSLKLNAGIGEIQRHAIAIGIRGQHHGTPTGADAVVADQALRG